MSLATPMTRLLGTVHPISQSGMRFFSRAELAAAVSEAGALGTIAAHTFRSGEALREEIRRARALTGRPIAVNLTILPSMAHEFPYDDFVDVLVGERIPVVETSGARPERYIDRLKSAGIVVMHKCTAARHARAAERMGADMVIMTGFESAGHPGPDHVPTLMLVSRTLQEVTIPVIASGGIADGRAMAAMLAVGAAGINMGTRFLLTQEAALAETARARLVAADERSTTLICRTLGDDTRVLKGPATDAVLALEAAGAGHAAIAPWIASDRWGNAYRTGELDDAPVPLGMSVGLCGDVPTCAELVTRMVGEAGERIRAANALLA